MADLGKQCTKCHVWKPLRDFGTDSAKADGRTFSCRDCLRAADKERARTGEPARVIRQRAFQRAMATLRDRHREEFEAIYAEALEAAKAEVSEHVEVAKATAKAPDAHRTVPLLKPGPRQVGETTPRLREDVGSCPLCVNRHDRGHVCPNCGARPQVVGPVVPAQFRGRTVV